MEKRISPFLTGGFSPNRMQSKWVYPFRPFTPSIFSMCYRGRMWRGGHPSPPLESGGNSCTSSELNPLVSSRLPRCLLGINKKERNGQRESVSVLPFRKHLTLVSLYPLTRDFACKRGTIRPACPKRLRIEFWAEDVWALANRNPHLSCRSKT